jgi:hypothetical protein
MQVSSLKPFVLSCQESDLDLSLMGNKPHPPFRFGKILIGNIYAHSSKKAYSFLSGMGLSGSLLFSFNESEIGATNTAGRKNRRDFFSAGLQFCCRMGGPFKTGNGLGPNPLLVVPTGIEPVFSA